MKIALQLGFLFQTLLLVAQEPIQDTLPKLDVFDLVYLNASNDTLIPLMDGLFLSRQKEVVLGQSEELANNRRVDQLYLNDMYNYGKLANWGVIDSLGKVILPFQYHAAKAINAKEGLAIIVDEAVPLPTGLVRTEFHVRAFYFDRKGLLSEGKPYKLVLVGNLDGRNYFAELLSVAPPLHNNASPKK